MSRLLQDKMNSHFRSAALSRWAKEAGGFWNGETLVGRVRDHADRNPDRVAIVDRKGTRRYTYGDLVRDQGKVIHLLKSNGIGAGDVVSIQLGNTYEAALAHLATLAIGAVTNPLLPSYRSHELNRVFRTVRPKAIFTPSMYRGWDYRPMIDTVKSDTNVRPFHVTDDNASGTDASLAAVLDEPVRSSTPASLGRHLHMRRADYLQPSEVIFTSGTEAGPKAIMHTEQTTNCAVRTAFRDLGLGPGTVVWMPSPLGHSTGLNYGLRGALYHGCKLVLQDIWDPSEAIMLIEQEACNYTLAATTFLMDLVAATERAGVELPGLTHFGCGGAPVPPELVVRAEEAGVHVLRLYGSTEALCATWNRPDSPRAKQIATDGPALSHVQIELRDPRGTIVMPPGEGEIYVRGPGTSIGLFNDQMRESFTYLPGAWIRSGDLGRLDGEGYLTVIGRAKEIIIRGGMNIAPREIEELMLTIPEVDRAAVVGIPDQRLGERSCACVILKRGCAMDLAQLNSRLIERGLASFKLPQALCIVDRFPITPSGKIQKYLLRDMAIASQATIQDGIG
jgi:acyl-coenzyme A synthetase/AMP-(fatty) acid ligase